MLVGVNLESEIIQQMTLTEKSNSVFHPGAGVTQWHPQKVSQ